jgi:polyisoprenoid-binding protein YceI
MRGSASERLRRPGLRPRRLALAALLLLANGPTAAAPYDPWPSQLPAGAYRLEAGRSNLTVRIRFLGLSRHAATFSRLAGGVDYNPADWAATHVAIQVDPRSLSNPRANVGRTMLDLLEPDRFPVIAFSSRGLVLENGRTWLVGDLTLHGVTRPVRFALTFQGANDKPENGQERLAFSGSGQIRRSDFGMPAMRALVRDQVDVLFKVEFTRGVRLGGGEPRLEPSAAGRQATVRLMGEAHAPQP